jgi:hypothetical protein
MRVLSVGRVSMTSSNNESIAIRTASISPLIPLYRALKAAFPKNGPTSQPIASSVTVDSPAVTIGSKPRVALSEAS